MRRETYGVLKNVANVRYARQRSNYLSRAPVGPALGHEHQIHRVRPESAKLAPTAEDGGLTDGLPGQC
jgi:hypothetical protein